jgi:hypothetical protein
MLLVTKAPQHPCCCAGTVCPELVQSGLVVRGHCCQRWVPWPCCIMLADGTEAVITQPVADALRVEPACVRFLFSASLLLKRLHVLHK